MKPALFASGLLAALAVSTAATAEVVKLGVAIYAAPAEALSEAPPPPAECLDAAGANRCIAVYIVEHDRYPPGWRFAWAEADTPTACVRAESASSGIDCTAANAVRTLAPTNVVQFASGPHATPEEALRRASAPPAACLDRAGINTCVAAFIPVGGDGEVFDWQAAWARPDSAFRCIDRSTLATVDCRAPDAVRSLVPPMMPPIPSIAFAPGSN